MKIRIKGIEETKFMLEMNWVYLGVIYDVIGINKDGYELNHIAITDEGDGRLVLFDDEYEVVE